MFVIVHYITPIDLSIIENTSYRIVLLKVSKTYEFTRQFV